MSCGCVFYRFLRKRACFLDVNQFFGVRVLFAYTIGCFGTPRSVGVHRLCNRPKNSRATRRRQLRISFEKVAQLTNAHLPNSPKAFVRPFSPPAERASDGMCRCARKGLIRLGETVRYRAARTLRWPVAPSVSEAAVLCRPGNLRSTGRSAAVFQGFIHVRIGVFYAVSNIFFIFAVY